MNPGEISQGRSVLVLAVADAVALVVFVLIGVRAHHEVGALDAVMRNAVPLELSWFTVAAVTGAYRRPGLRTLLWTWVVAVPAGIVVRSLWIGSPSGLDLLTFLGVGSAFTLLFLLVARAAVGGFDPRSRRRAGRDRVEP